MLEARLFAGDLRAALGAIGSFARHNLTYLRLSIVPFLWMVVPLGSFVAQLEFHYGYGGLEVGRPTLVKVRLLVETRRPDLVLRAPSGIRIDTSAVWIPSLREAVWRVVAERAGEYELTVTAGGTGFTKTVRVSNAVIRRSPYRGDGRLLDQLRYPAQVAITGWRCCRIDRGDSTRDEGSVRSVSRFPGSSRISDSPWSSRWRSGGPSRSCSDRAVIPDLLRALPIAQDNGDINSRGDIVGTSAMRRS